MHPQDADTRLSIAERFAALSRVGTAMMSELDETRLLQLIAETACQLTHATFAAFCVRPTNEAGQLVDSSEENSFHVAAVVGVTDEQKALFRRMPPGGEGLLAPIFRHGVSVRIPDALAHLAHSEETQMTTVRESARVAAFEYAHGQLSSHDLRSMGVPHGHPLVRSFLGAPLLDRERQVRGGLLLGHTDPNCFTPEDEALLVGLAAQAAVAMENTRRDRAAQARAQELDAIFETIVDGITLIDPQGNIRTENGTARRLREQLQASPEGKRVIEEHLYTPAHRALKDEAVQNISVSVPDKRNETREYTVNASPLRFPTTPLSVPLQQDEHRSSHASKSISGAVVVWHDVTEARRLLLERRVHAETEARRALLQLIIEELPSSVYLVQGEDARLVLANHAATTLWGVPWPIGEPMHEFLARNGIRIFGVDGRALEAPQLATIRAVQASETIRQHQEVIRHADGTTFPVQVNAVPLPLPMLAPRKNHADQENAHAALVVHQDVTALKEAELVKDEFIGLAAHELQTPLAVLKGFVQTLVVQTARGKGLELAEWQSEALREIDQTTIRLVNLTEDLLDVTRLQAGRLEMHLEPIDVIQYVQLLITRIQPTTEQHQISLHTTLSHLVVSVDARRIEQVLINLLSNAIKFSPTGGSIEVTIQHDEQTNMGLLRISDHGIGIPASQQARIFGRFARADNAQAHGISGTGLGLYLCRELVERQGGRIWFESVEGKGSTFWIAFPLPSNTPLTLQPQDSPTIEEEY